MKKIAARKITEISVFANLLAQKLTVTCVANIFLKTELVPNPIHVFI